MELPLNCANCDHYDGDGYCALKQTQLLIVGFIADPKLVVCAKHEPKEPDQSKESV